jgi:hypothetical protein
MIVGKMLTKQLPPPPAQVPVVADFVEPLVRVVGGVRVMALVKVTKRHV